MNEKQAESAYSADETQKRFAAILRGATHKPTPHKDVPKQRKRKPTKTYASRASAKTEPPET